MIKWFGVLLGMMLVGAIVWVVLPRTPEAADQCLSLATAKLPENLGLTVLDRRVVPYEGHVGAVKDLAERDVAQAELDEFRDSLANLEKFYSQSNTGRQQQALLDGLRAGLKQQQTRLDWFPQNPGEMRRMVEFDVRTSGQVGTYVVICAWHRDRAEFIQTHAMGLLAAREKK